MEDAKVVYVVDDDLIIRRSLGVVLQAAGYRAHPFVNGKDFLEASSYLQSGCVLLDIHMPGLDGLEVQQRLNESRSDLPVVIMSAAGDIPLAVQAIKAGAIDFIEKPFADQRLLDVLEQNFAMMADRKLGDTRREEALARLASLSERELAVVSGLRAGMPNKVIAYELGLGVRTVETHRANMMRKLGVRSVAEVVSLSLEAGIRPLEPGTKAA